MPTRYRDDLSSLADGRLTITKNPDGYLMLFPRPEWERVRERISALPDSAQWWKRSLLGRAMDVEIDGAGRVLISPELRESAGIVRDVMMLGANTHLELWDRSTLKALEAQAAQREKPASVQNFQFKET